MRGSPDAVGSTAGVTRTAVPSPDDRGRNGSDNSHNCSGGEDATDAERSHERVKNDGRGELTDVARHRGVGTEMPLFLGRNERLDPGERRRKDDAESEPCDVRPTWSIPVDERAGDRAREDDTSPMSCDYQPGERFRNAQSRLNPRNDGPQHYPRHHRERR